MTRMDKFPENKLNQFYCNKMPFAPEKNLVNKIKDLNLVI